MYVIHSKVPNTFPFQTSDVQMRINSFSKFSETRKKLNSPQNSFNVIMKDLENNMQCMQDYLYFSCYQLFNFLFEKSQHILTYSVPNVP